MGFNASDGTLSSEPPVTILGPASTWGIRSLCTSPDGRFLGVAADTKVGVLGSSACNLLETCLKCPEDPPTNATFGRPNSCFWKCNSGRFWLVNATNSSGFLEGYGRGACELCRAGTYSDFALTPPSLDEGACFPCATGKFSTATGLMSASQCQDCPAGSYANSLVGATACDLCPAGSYGTSGGQSACALCSAGTYSNRTGASASSTCTACPAGSASPSSGAPSLASCVPCAAGSYAPSAAATACTPCAAGYFGNVTGASALSRACFPCPPGSFSAAHAATACDTCPGGTSSVAASTNCTSI